MTSNNNIVENNDLNDFNDHDIQKQQQSSQQQQQQDQQSIRVIGGTNVQDQDRYPYFSLMWDNEMCGGSLIGNDLIITAAHVSWVLYF